MGGYDDLHVWRRAMDWAEAVYKLSAQWPADERFGLTSQTRRAAVSVPTNIAEGAARRTKGEFLSFLGIARGSLAEVDTLLQMARRLGYGDAGNLSPLLSETKEIGRMLSSLISSVQRSTARSRASD